MDTETLFTAIRVLACILIGGLALYYQANARLKEAVTGLISQAESLYRDTVKAGGMKHAYVTEQLYRMLPVYIRPILTKDILSSMVDNAFAAVEDYAKKQIDKAVQQVLEAAAAHREDSGTDTGDSSDAGHSDGAFVPRKLRPPSQNSGTESGGHEQI